jgi:hypothetical protein
VENDLSNSSDESGREEEISRGLETNNFGEKQSVSFSAVKNSLIFPLHQANFTSPMIQKCN